MCRYSPRRPRTPAGDVQCHALLLASLLLGFGLDAYVCVGTLATEPEAAAVRRGPREAMGDGTDQDHVWVVTRERGPGAEGPLGRILTASDPVGACAGGAWVATHWESLTGAQFRQDHAHPYDKVRLPPVPPTPRSERRPLPRSAESHARGTPPTHPHRTPQVGCLISPQGVWANKQRRDDATHTLFDLQDGALWHSMQLDAVSLLKPAKRACATALRILRLAARGAVPRLVLWRKAGCLAGNDPCESGVHMGVPAPGLIPSPRSDPALPAHPTSTCDGGGCGGALARLCRPASRS